MFLYLQNNIAHHLWPDTRRDKETSGWVTWRRVSSTGGHFEGVVLREVVNDLQRLVVQLQVCRHTTAINERDSDMEEPAGGDTHQRESLCPLAACCVCTPWWPLCLRPCQRFPPLRSAPPPAGNNKVRVFRVNLTFKIKWILKYFWTQVSTCCQCVSVKTKLK